MAPLIRELLIVSAGQAFAFFNEPQLEELVLMRALRPLCSFCYRQFEGRGDLLHLPDSKILGLQ